MSEVIIPTEDKEHQEPTPNPKNDKISEEALYLATKNDTKQQSEGIIPQEAKHKLDFRACPDKWDAKTSLSCSEKRQHLLVLLKAIKNELEHKSRSLLLNQNTAF